MAGYSILQLIVALTLAATALAIAFPAFQSKPFNLGADVQDLTANLQVAREWATSRGKHYRVRVVNSTSPYQYVIEGLNGGAWGVERTVNLRANEAFDAGTLGATAEFDTRGMLISLVAPVTFTVKDTARSWTKRITVNSVGMVDHP